MNQRDDYIDEHLDKRIKERIADMDKWEILDMSIFHHGRQMEIREVIADEIETKIADELGKEFDER